MTFYDPCLLRICLGNILKWGNFRMGGHFVNFSAHPFKRLFFIYCKY
uniref:Uncharacterized protein n=1 Tax=Lepeophtheirus salmonis TaxID=72036 RepID=A0A0K2TUX8_LEPSM